MIPATRPILRLALATAAALTALLAATAHANAATSYTTTPYMGTAYYNFMGCQFYDDGYNPIYKRAWVRAPDFTSAPGLSSQGVAWTADLIANGGSTTPVESVTGWALANNYRTAPYFYFYGTSTPMQRDGTSSYYIFKSHIPNGGATFGYIVRNTVWFQQLDGSWVKQATQFYSLSGDGAGSLPGGYRMPAGTGTC